MSHFAKVENGVVTQVIVAEQEFIDTGAVGDPSFWKQTSYNTRGGVHYQPNSSLPSVDQSKAFRKNYAGIGYYYDSDRDAFYSPSPYPSWVLDEATCWWNPPYAMPSDSGTVDGNGNTIIYNWDEDQHTSNGNGWVQTLIAPPPAEEEPA
jgi:hypothetical protein